MKVRLTALAERDLDDLWFRLAIEASETLATRIVEAIWTASRCLEAFPYSGSPREGPPEGLRVLIHGPYTIYHLVLEQDVVVTRIAHHAQDAAALTGLGRTV